MFKLALIQMLVEGGKKTENLNRARRSIREAASRGAEMVLLPEAMDLGWTHPSAKSEAGEIPDGETCQILRELARELDIYVCSGLIEKAQDNIYKW